MPVISTTNLPEAFGMAFLAEKQLLLENDDIAKNSEVWVEEWVKSFNY